MYKPEYRILPPQPLSDNLYQVHDDSYLLEDVVVGQTHEEPSRWFTDSKVHLGVRAALKLDHCVEEETQLPMEARTMCE
jgi:hypothetical protein